MSDRLTRRVQQEVAAAMSHELDTILEEQGKRRVKISERAEWVRWSAALLVGVAGAVASVIVALRIHALEGPRLEVSMVELGASVRVDSEGGELVTDLRAGGVLYLTNSGRASVAVTGVHALDPEVDSEWVICLGETPLVIAPGDVSPVLVRTRSSVIAPDATLAVNTPSTVIRVDAKVMGDERASSDLGAAYAEEVEALTADCAETLEEAWR